MASDSEKPKDPSFQVVDKRRFDTSGHERTAQPAEQPAHEALAAHKPSSSETAQQFTLQESPSDANAEPVAFTSFIMSLATQVLVQLGEMAPPSGMEIPFDRESARQTIDIITMLQKRTKGNLSQEEARFLEEVVHSLRVSYLHGKAK